MLAAKAAAYVISLNRYARTGNRGVLLKKGSSPFNQCTLADQDKLHTKDSPATLCDVRFMYAS